MDCSYRIRKGLPSEARVVSRILPQFLEDFFPPQDVMNKVIGEFLSNQQPYPQFMATVVYKVGSKCANKKYLSSNFIVHLAGI